MTPDRVALPRSEDVWLRGFWHPACASSRLRKSPVASRVLDTDLVVFRGPKGKPAVLEDRCPHRGVQLSIGRLRNGTVACRYHGWRYDRTGRCVEIPSLVHDRIPAACRVRRFECVEQDGYVWVWLSENPPPSPPPVIEGFGTRGWVQGSMSMRCYWLAGVENNLDWCHPAFTHRWTHPQFYAKLLHRRLESTYELRTGGTGHLEVFSPPAGSHDDAIPERTSVRLTFELPNRVIVKINHGRLAIILHFVPTGPETCRMEWMRATFIGRRVRWSRRNGLVNLQDRQVLESAQPHRGERQISVSADASSLAARRIVEQSAASPGCQQANAMPRRRVVNVRL